MRIKWPAIIVHTARAVCVAPYSITIERPHKTNAKVIQYFADGMRRITNSF